MAWQQVESYSFGFSPITKKFWLTTRPKVFGRNASLPHPHAVQRIGRSVRLGNRHSIRGRWQVLFNATQTVRLGAIRMSGCTLGVRLNRSIEPAFPRPLRSLWPGAPVRPEVPPAQVQCA